MPHKTCICSVLWRDAVVRCNRFGLGHRCTCTVELNCLQNKNRRRHLWMDSIFFLYLVFSFARFWMHFWTHRSLKWLPNVRCNFWPDEVFRFWTIFVFSARSVSIGEAWQMPNLHWKHMDCNYLKLFLPFRWNVMMARTHTYVFCIVHVHSPVAVQLVFPFHSCWTNVRWANRQHSRHCIVHYNTRVHPFCVCVCVKNK